MKISSITSGNVEGSQFKLGLFKTSLSTTRSGISPTITVSQILAASIKDD
jgi:hypothetical protein